MEGSTPLSFWLEAADEAKDDQEHVKTLLTSPGLRFVS